MEKNKVILIGIGPGDPELLTLKGYNAIKAADVILFDSEQAEEILKIAGKHSQIIKINKDRSLPYAEVVESITKLIEQHFYAGKNVVRLKVGDAFLFGRGGTEASILKERGINLEVIPGITSGIAASNINKIKISEKNEADGVVFYMANQKADQENNLKAIAGNLLNGFTLIAYMAEGRIAKLAQCLVEYGVSKDIRIIAVSNTTGSNQTIKSGELGQVIENREWNDIEPQTTFFIGQFVDVIEEI